MRRHVALAVLAGAVAVWGAVPVAVAGVAAAWAGSAAPAVRAAGSWGRAFGVPGLHALNKGGDAQVTSVSCLSAGNCSAGGIFQSQPGNHGTSVFVVSERHGVWGRAIDVRQAGVITSVSCASAGNCAAVGSTGTSLKFGFSAARSGPVPVQRGLSPAGKPSCHPRATSPDCNPPDEEAFIINERDGVWGKAIQVPGLSALDGGVAAEITSVSCPSAGNCAAGGTYELENFDIHAFVVSERNGMWHRAIQLSSMGALGANIYGGVLSVSCASAGNCTAGGYDDGSVIEEGFLAAERNGVWHRAFEVPGLGALGSGRYAYVDSVSCGSAGNCAAGGIYWDRSMRYQGFVVSERNGVWHRALEVPGLGALNTGLYAQVTSVSCSSAANCAAGGYYSLPRGLEHGFLAAERNGTWHQAFEVPGLSAPNANRYAQVTSVSCSSPGNCAAGGFYTDRHGHRQGFVVSQRNGVWHRLTEAPGPGILNLGGNAGILAVSCAPASTCTAGGYYTGPALQHQQGFLIDQTR